MQTGGGGSAAWTDRETGNAAEFIFRYLGEVVLNDEWRAETEGDGEAENRYIKHTSCGWWRRWGKCDEANLLWESGSTNTRWELVTN